MRIISTVIFLILLSSIIGCQSVSRRAVGEDGTQLQNRSIQTRKFSNLTKTQALRASIATLQDLNFIIDKADYVLGSVTGTKLSHGIIKISIVVRSKNNDIIIRANARQGKYQISQPEVYQNFFSVLDKSVFLLKNNVN